MLLKSPISIVPVSGFVAFDGGGSTDRDSYLVPRRSGNGALVQPALPAFAPGADVAPVQADAAQGGMLQSATWQPAIAARSRFVEGAVILAICGYFVFGFAGLVHWI